MLLGMQFLILSVLMLKHFIPTISFLSIAEFSISQPHIIQLSKKLSSPLIRPMLFSSPLPKLSLSLLGPLLLQRVPVLPFPSKVARIPPTRSTLFPSKPIWPLVQPVYLPKRKLQRVPR